MRNARALHQLLRREEELNCGPGGGADTFFNLRVAAIFIVLAGSTFGATFPVLARRSSWLKVPTALFDFAKYFGSGVIIATAFIHLLDPALEALGNPCLPAGWSEYPYALAISLVSIFCIFLVELIAFRWGSTKLAAIGASHDPHGHSIGGAHAAHGPESPSTAGPPTSAVVLTQEKLQDDDTASQSQDPEQGHKHSLDLHMNVVDSGITQILGVAILEFGVLLHSVLIGLTLAVDEDFKILFIVVVFHQTFEGLGIGARLAYMKLPSKYSYVSILGALLYGVTTPVGIAVGLGLRATYNPASTTASIVSGILDAISSGILIYTGLVELLAHEFLFNKEMINSSNGKLAYAIGSMMLGCALMALLGKWA